MSESVIVALVTGAVTILCQILINKSERSKEDVKRAVRQQQIDDALNNIGKKLDEHNGYAQKFGEISIAIAEIRKDIEYLRHKN